MILQRSVKEGPEEFVVVLDVLQLEVLHDDGFGAVVVGDDAQRAALGHIARLGLHGPEVGIQSHVDARQRGQVRRNELAQWVFAIDGLVADEADDE